MVKYSHEGKDFDSFSLKHLPNIICFKCWSIGTFNNANTSPVCKDNALYSWVFSDRIIYFLRHHFQLDFEYLGVLTNNIFILPVCPNGSVNVYACKKDCQLSLCVRWWNFIAQMEFFQI